MVPNHVGMDGKWIVEHPERFLQLPHSPFPSYTFNGPNLNNIRGSACTSKMGIGMKRMLRFSFKRVDHGTGEETYIYHGNDGTQMPWNDTAQLDYLKARSARSCDSNDRRRGQAFSHHSIRCRDDPRSSTY